MIGAEIIVEVKMSYSDSRVESEPFIQKECFLPEDGSDRELVLDPAVNPGLAPAGTRGKRRPQDSLQCIQGIYGHVSRG